MGGRGYTVLAEASIIPIVHVPLVTISTIKAYMRYDKRTGSVNNRLVNIDGFTCLYDLALCEMYMESSRHAQLKFTLWKRSPGRSPGTFRDLFQ